MKERFVSLLELDDDPIAFLSDSLEFRRDARRNLIDRGLVKGHEGELKVWINSFEYNSWAQKNNTQNILSKLPPKTPKNKHKKLRHNSA